MANKEDKIVVWPFNLDIERSRKDGRKVPKKFAIKEPTVKDIEKAAEKLGLNPVVEKKKAHPKEWWGLKGRVKLDKLKSKNNTLKEIGGNIRKMKNKR